MINLFKMNYPISRRASFLVTIAGMILILGIWSLITFSGWISKAIIPTPLSVITSFKELHFNDLLVRNTFYSIKLNVYGYIEAIAISLILGFIIGLIPFFKSLLNRYVNAIRFIPLTAVTGLFIAWFGIETNMKVQFLAFGIIVYLLPVVVQRISEIDNIYLQTSYTLGASNWQIFKSVYWPFVTSKIFEDIRVLTAISWTYIIVAELVNKTGGVGALIFTAARQSRLDKVFAVLFVIIIIGILQDRVFQWLDKKLFPFKHA
jgi:NitT/TauT family transport system permease protein